MPQTIDEASPTTMSRAPLDQLIVGIDISSDIEKTAAVTIEFTGRSLRIEPHEGVSDAEIQMWAGRARCVAIDAPFG